MLRELYKELSLRCQNLDKHSLDFDLSGVDGPLLIEVPDEYWRETSKMMYFGQETAGWTSLANFMKGESGTEDALREYATFDFAENSGVRGSPFWVLHRELSEALDISYRSLIWNNLCKFGFHNEASNTYSILDSPLEAPLLSLQDDLLTREIERLEVEICVFVSGPYYDRLIQRAFPDARFMKAFENFDERQIAAVDLGLNANIRAIRTYHPNYLRQGGLWPEVKAALLQFISQ